MNETNPEQPQADAARGASAADADAGRTGGCLCGAIRYRIDVEPLAVRICWCRDCQRLASNGTVNAMVPTEALVIDGAPMTVTRTAASGNQVSRRFCAGCGSHLFADSTGRPGVTVVRVGTLDDPSSVTPTVNIWAASAPGWARLDPALERVYGQPRPPAAPASSR